NIPLWSFVVIAIGFFGCAVGGVVSARVGSARVATVQLAISGLCCILSAYVYTLNVMVFLGFMLIWGISVIGDSPQFSTLNAQNAPKQLVGSALTIVNSIGFLITVISIQLVNLLLPFIDTQFIFWLLIPGPLLGLLAMQSMPPGKD
ncbi:MAG: MFS family permease, partial [Gammaproteobacteria bacterium]